MSRWSKWIVLAVVLVALSATALAQMRPRHFCGCPDHPQPRDGASVTAPGTSYRLHAYDDAFKSSPSEPWCYTRAVWFDAVRATGRFEWQAADEREVLSGAVAQDADPCDTQSTYQSPTGPTQQRSTIQHGPMLGSSTNIALYSAEGDEFKPSLRRGSKSSFHFSRAWRIFQVAFRRHRLASRFELRQS
jgi:hypothetical protein